jgi:ribosomal protein L22
MNLDEAAKFLFGTTERKAALRTEIKKGRLIACEIAGKFFVTEENLRGMQERCRVKPEARTSTGTQKKKHGLSETEPEPSAPDAAIQNLKLQKFSAPNTSRKNTGRKSGKSAQIVSLARQS